MMRRLLVVAGLAAVAVALLLTLPSPKPPDAPRHALRVAPDASIELAAAWEPTTDSRYGMFKEHEVLRAVKPAEPRRAYAAPALAALLPPGPVALGDLWPITPAAALAFLTQFHPGARGSFHHGFGSYDGAAGVLRAVSPHAFEILLRVHAEFDLDGGVTYTPGQFEGRLLLARDGGRPLGLRLGVPDRNPNVDANVPNKPAGGAPGSLMQIDIGWVPRMELAGGAFEPHPWTEEISDAEARARLARSFYPFARVEWLPFEKAVLRARDAGKPLHLVALFGTMDDESC